MEDLNTMIDEVESAGRRGDYLFHAIPEWQVIIRLARVGAQVEQQQEPRCEDCSKVLHERDGHLCLNGEWR